MSKRPTLTNAILFYQRLERQNGTRLSPGSNSFLYELIKKFNKTLWKHPLQLSQVELFELARVTDRKSLTRFLKDLSSATHPYISYVPGKGRRKQALLDLTYLTLTEEETSSDKTLTGEESPSDNASNRGGIPLPIIEVIKTSSCRREQPQPQNVLFFDSKNIVKLTPEGYSSLLSEFGEDGLKARIEAYVKFAESKPEIERTNFTPEYCLTGIRKQRVKAPEKQESPPDLSPEAQRSMEEQKKQQKRIKDLRRQRKNAKS